MPVTIYQMSVPVFIRALTNLRNILGKGAAHAAARKIDDAVFTSTRLYPDMYPLTSQVHIATDMARAGAARLTGGDPPKYEDNETTFAELIARVDKTIDYLKSVPEAQFEGAETRKITRPVGGKPKEFTGLSYLQWFILPNLFFHTTVAYALLRHTGVDVGKSDYIGPLD